MSELDDIADDVIPFLRVAAPALPPRCTRQLTKGRRCPNRATARRQGRLFCAAHAHPPRNVNP